MFDFNIGNLKNQSLSTVTVNNSQIEIDAAYEGIHSLALFEAKRDLSEDFLVRQLYYPYRVWKSRMTKPVRPLFLVYSNGIYRIYEYEFKDPNNYSSTALETMKNRYNELKEKCKPYLEAMEHFPELVRNFVDKVRELFIVKEAQKQAEKEAKEKARQERIKARRNKRGMER